MFNADFEAMLLGSEALQKHKNLLKTLSDDRVMCVEHRIHGNFYIEESCDEWYYHDLTKEECLELSEMFKEIATEIDN